MSLNNDTNNAYRILKDPASGGSSSSPNNISTISPHGGYEFNANEETGGGARGSRSHGAQHGERQHDLSCALIHAPEHSSHHMSENEIKIISCELSSIGKRSLSVLIRDIA